jgi:hypothetical protein
MSTLIEQDLRVGVDPEKKAKGLAAFIFIAGLFATSFLRVEQIKGGCD